MNKTLLAVVLTAVLVIFVGTYFVEDLSSPKEVEEKVNSAITKTVQEYPLKKLKGYDVISFEKIERFGAPVYYKGIASNCDLGTCDTVYFNSMALPKLGKGVFEYEYSTNIYNTKWNLIKQ